jgi:hypothetical protein
MTAKRPRRAVEAGSVLETPFTGACGCGAIRYRCSAPPVTSFHCYCRDCQRATGGACATVVLVPLSALDVEGEPILYECEAESGQRVQRRFCGTGGSPLDAGSLALPDRVGVYVATLDDPGGVEPAANTWTRSRPPWARLDARLPAFERGRDAGPVKTEDV